MPEAGIPGPAAVNLPAPRNRMVRAHLAALVGALVETRDHRRLAARAARVIVELIGDPPGDRGGGAERTREAHDAGLQAGRMALELRPEELPVPGPVVSGVGRRMDAEVTAARFDESLEGPLLRAVEDIAGRVDEAHRLEARESVGPEETGVLGVVDRDAVTRREVAECGDRGRDRVVAVAGGPGEDQHAVAGGRGGLPLQRAGEGEQQHHQPAHEPSARGSSQTPTRTRYLFPTADMGKAWLRRPGGATDGSECAAGLWIWIPGASIESQPDRREPLGLVR